MLDNENLIESLAINEVEVLCNAEISSIGVEEKKLILTSSFLDLNTWALMLEYPANTSAVKMLGKTDNTERQYYR